jgi:hypothetical protein
VSLTGSSVQQIILCGIRGNSQATDHQVWHSDVNTVLPEDDNKIDQAAKRLNLVLTWCKVYSKTWGRTAYKGSLTGSSVQQIILWYTWEAPSIVFRPASALCVLPERDKSICQAAKWLDLVLTWCKSVQQNIG